MTVHFAAARTPAASPVARALTRVELGNPANDNGAVQPHDTVLRSALRHFATHGLGAARDAREKAHAAFFAGDREAYDMWLGVCRTLDRRLAEELARNVSARDASESSAHQPA